MANTIKALLSHYDAAFRKKFGYPAPINGGKDAALAKQLLGIYTLEQLQEWVDQFFEMDDAWIQQTGYSFGVFRSQLGKVIVQGVDQQGQKRQQGNERIMRIMRSRE